MLDSPLWSRGSDNKDKCPVSDIVDLHRRNLVLSGTIISIMGIQAIKSEQTGESHVDI